MRCSQIIQHTPFESQVDKPLAIGFNETFLLKTGNVLHLCVDVPDIQNLTKDEFTTIERFYPSNKGERIASYVRDMSQTSSVAIPKVESAGTIVAPLGTITYWEEQQAKGKSAWQLGDDFSLNDYRAVVDWLSIAHNPPQRQLPELASIYEERGVALHRLLASNTNLHDYKAPFSRALCYFNKLIGKMSDERSVNTHGDLHLDNIMKTTGEPEAPNISIIDFEMGIAGPSDGIRDLQKLLHFDHEALGIPRRSCAPNLDAQQKMELLATYTERTGNSHIMNKSLLAERLTLLALDAYLGRLASMSIYRAKTGLMPTLSTDAQEPGRIVSQLDFFCDIAEHKLPRQITP